MARIAYYNKSQMYVVPIEKSIFGTIVNFGVIYIYGNFGGFYSFCTFAKFVHVIKVGAICIFCDFGNFGNFRWGN